MQKKWAIVLSIIDVACLSAVTAMSVIVWAVQDKNKSITGSGSITVDNGGGAAEISAQLSAGINGANGTVTGILDNALDAVNLANPQDINDLVSFDIGEITLAAAGCVNIWFTVTNSTAANLTVTVSLTDEGGQAFAVPGYVEAAHYTVAYEQNKCEDLSGAFDCLSIGLDKEYEPAIIGDTTYRSGEEYLQYYGISENNTAVIPHNKTQTLIVRFTIDALAETVNFCVNLNFSV
jgi:hypothetical protein